MKSIAVVVPCGRGVYELHRVRHLPATLTDFTVVDRGTFTEITEKHGFNFELFASRKHASLDDVDMEF